jgi:type III restriction enzyme
VSQVFGVPFEVIPFKANPQGAAKPREKRHHVHAIPEKARYEIRFPRVEGYTQAIRNRVTVNWSEVPPLVLQPDRIPPDVQMKALSVNNAGRQSLSGPGRLSDATLKEFRAKRRLQELVFEFARTLTKAYVAQPRCEAPAHVLFPQIVKIVQRYLAEKVHVHPPAEIKDTFLAPYYGWVVEILLEAVRADTTQGEATEVPRYEVSRGPGSTADVDFWTSREPREVLHSHLNYMVPDTQKWEQSATYFIDKHAAVDAFVKNAGLGFAIPYLHNGQMHDYVPDFIVRLNSSPPVHLILETKGYDPLEEVKRGAAERWVAAVNADGTYGRWKYAIAKRVSEVNEILAQAAT